MPSLDDLFLDLTGGDEVRAETAACELAKSGDRVLPRLEAMLGSSNADHRWWSVRTLAEMSAPRHEWLIRGLGDSSAEVRSAAALALAAHPTEVAIPALIGVLDDDDSVVCALAVSALAAIGTPAVPGLIEAFEDASPRVRIHIMRALAEIRDMRAISLMMKAMDQDSAVLQYWAKEGLERLGLNMVYIKPE